MEMRVKNESKREAQVTGHSQNKSASYMDVPQISWGNRIKKEDI